jgi:[ribosomal protein S18]-alanine N-acetyltransferase
MRPATLDDIADICELEYLVFPENNFNEVTLANELVLGAGLVVYENNKLVAYMLMRNDGQIIDIIRLGVHPDYQRKGYGTKLLSAVPKREAMLTVQKNNVGALRLYLRHGFSIVGKLAMDVGGWVMTRR